MTHQQQIHLERESERQRQLNAIPEPGTVHAGSSLNGNTHGICARDPSGRYCYVQLMTSTDTRQLIAELLKVERIQRAGEEQADECPDTERSTPRSKSEPPGLDRVDEIRGAT
jgi:hypothetical protein